MVNIVNVENPDQLPGPELGGCDPRTDQLGENHPLFSSSFPTFPRSQWDVQDSEEASEALVDKIFNQKSEGSCTSNSWTQAYQIIYGRTYGINQVIHFSPITLFKPCSSSSRGGSTISCNGTVLKEKGLLPEDTEENKSWMRSVGLNDLHVLQPVGYGQRFPQDWEQTAFHFRAKETFDIANFDEFATAMQMGFPVVYGRAGHCICGVRLIKHNGQWAVRYANSWGNWGDQGYGIDTESYISRDIRRYGAVALRSIFNHELYEQGQ